MKILIVADLHYRSEWYIWLTQRKVDLVVIAGDLLDGFSPGGVLPQMVAFSAWSKIFPIPLALCSGNHDGNARGFAVDENETLYLSASQKTEAAGLVQANRWMDMLERPGVVVDARSEILTTPAGQIVVTTIPFDFGEMPQNTEALWRTGATLRNEFRLPWLVLHHEPPADTTVGGRNGDPHLCYQIRDYRPDFVASGHLHDQPYRGDFIDRLNETWCLNPGSPPLDGRKAAQVPNHILLDLAEKSATWHATPRTGNIPIQKTRSLK
jgi:predicted phosphodiesterase